MQGEILQRRNFRRIPAYNGAMRRIIPAMALLALLTVPAQALAPLSGFASGQWRATAVGGKGSARSMCLTSATLLLTEGRPQQGCQFNRIREDDGEAVVTYRCETGLAGRTEVRRDAAGIYTVRAQGYFEGRPFSNHSEWRRVGDC
jgi:hypothetical protein